MTTNISRKMFIETIYSMVKDGIFPHLHLCGPHENDVRKVAHSIISPHYENNSPFLISESCKGNKSCIRFKNCKGELIKIKFF